MYAKIVSTTQAADHMAARDTGAAVSRETGAAAGAAGIAPTAAGATGNAAPAAATSSPRRLFPPGAGPAVKICGLTQEEDVALACELGAWAVGFVLAPSPRRVDPADITRLLERVPARAALAVGVFVEESAPEIADAAWEAGLDAVQLHGGVWGPSVAEVRRALSAFGGRTSGDGGPGGGRVGSWPPLVIAVVAVSPDEDDPKELREKVDAVSAADVLLFDTCMSRSGGGSGVPFSWSLARQAAGDRPFLVAGGIGPANAGIALQQSGASGIDVASGVESSPGKKDERLLRTLFAALRPENEEGTRS
jgi:phosphoribosylanthranilate isomerase